MKLTLTVPNSQEGIFFLKWMESRLIKQNKNVITVELGPSGSGKSYRDLRKFELWYKYHFNKAPPMNHICFSVAEVMQLLSSEKLRKGDVIIFEEVGVNVGARDWQSKINNMFNYILQSFRSLNLALFMNVPYITMLDKQSRFMVHYYAESVGIDPEIQKNKCKPFFVQIAQGTGKIYRHYPIGFINGKRTKIKRFSWGMPSKELIEVYETRKSKFLKDLAKQYNNKLNEGKKKDVPTPIMFQCYWDYQEGISQSKVGERRNIHRVTVSDYIKKVKKYINSYKNEANDRENKGLS